MISYVIKITFFSFVFHIMATVESSAIQVLMRAVELDQEHKYDESLTCYEQGIRLLLQASRGKLLTILPKCLFFVSLHSKRFQYKLNV